MKCPACQETLTISERQDAETLREELTLARIDRHSGQLEALDVECVGTGATAPLAGDQNRK